MKVFDARTEYRVNPIGLDEMHPRFSWKLLSEKANCVQRAYRLTAYEDAEGQVLLWDSGRVESDESLRIRWEGPELTSGQRVWWKVCVETAAPEGDETAQSETAFFEMGLLKPEDWRADWIEPLHQDDYMNFQPAPYLRKTFNVKPCLKKARIYQTAHGLYEFRINGAAGTEEKFKPGFTSYHERLQYQVYDISHLLKEGENTWAVTLGDGWWRGSLGGMSRNNWGYRLQFLGQIVLTYEDGTEEYVCTDESFRSAYGGLRRCDLRAGELFDSSLEPAGWMETGFDDSAWENCILSEDAYAVKDRLIASASVPVLEREHFVPTVFRDGNDDLILDFGQNIAGYVRMTLRNCRPGQEVVLQHGEDLLNGCFSILNISPDNFDNTAFQEVRYIAKGGEKEEYCPDFAVFGFRYVKVTGYDCDFKPEDFTAFAVYSALDETGDFSCSNPLINQLVSNSRWSQKGNYLDVPTDCPTRERSPWTGDSQVYCRTAADFMNVYPFFEKWMKDYNCDITADGKVANCIPRGSRNAEENLRARDAFFAGIQGKEELSVIENIMAGMYAGDISELGATDAGAGWSDAVVINPYTMYLCYGDRQILENQYESAKKHVDYMFRCARNANPMRKDEPEYHTFTDGEADADYIWDTEFHWGEWLEADIGTEGEMQVMMQKYTNPDPEVPTAFLCYSSRLLGQMAAILGRTAEAQEYAERSEKVKRVFNKYLIKENGTIKPGRQAPNVRALAFDLCSEENRKPVFDELVRLVRENDYHLNTGFLATPFILDVLADGGAVDAAYALLEQESSPSWLYNVKNGATTILEEWNGMVTHAGSFNHYSYGAVCNFLFTKTAGIQPVLSDPGYKKFVIRPVIGGSLNWAKSCFESQYGTIRSEWSRENGETAYLFEVPVNTTAVAEIPAEPDFARDILKKYPDAVYENQKIRVELGSGIWKF